MNTVMHSLLPAVMMIIIAMGCGGGERASPREATGTVYKQEMSSYQYGSHVLVNDTGAVIYALSSAAVDLDVHAGKGVTVRGDLLPGYPVDGGPPHLHVLSVR